MKIDLNADLGEGCASDAELLTLVSSANIACGFHAGDAQIMQACVREAIKNGVAIGAHPSFPDRENFGRSAMQLPPETVYAQTLYQIGALATIARAQGGVMRHVKPHGMLYNQAAKEAQLADAIARAVYACDPALILVGLAGSELIRAGKQYGLTTREEVFADRGYQADGSLVPRSQSGALIENEETGAGANAGDGATRQSQKYHRRMGNGRGANGLPAWRRRARTGVRPPTTLCICRKGDCCRSITPINKE